MGTRSALSRTVRAARLRRGGVLCESREISDYFAACVPAGDAKLASNWVMTELMRVLNQRGWDVSDWAVRVPAERFRDFLSPRRLRASCRGRSRSSCSAGCRDESGSVAELLERHGIKVAGGEDELRPLVRAVLDENPGPVAQVLAGRDATFGFLVGMVMKKSGGQAVPQMVNQLLREELAARKRA